MELRKSVLLIDSEPESHRLLQEFFTRHGSLCAIVLAEDGQVGSWKLANQKFDSVVVNCRAKKVETLTLATEIKRKQTRGLPVVGFYASAKDRLAFRLLKNAVTSEGQLNQQILFDGLESIFEPHAKSSALDHIAVINAFDESLTEAWRSLFPTAIRKVSIAPSALDPALKKAVYHFTDQRIKIRVAVNVSESCENEIADVLLGYAHDRTMIAPLQVFSDVVVQFAKIRLRNQDREIFPMARIEAPMQAAVSIRYRAKDHLLALEVAVTSIADSRHSPPPFAKVSN